jgi:hypothetical protein
VVFKFDNPAIRERKDYRAVWRAVFFALKLNLNDELQVEEKRKWEKREKEEARAEAMMTPEQKKASEERASFGLPTIYRPDEDNPF